VGALAEVVEDQFIRLFAALGVGPVRFLPSRRASELPAVGEGTRFLLAQPFLAGTARALEARGARHIPAPFPLGEEGTTAWLRAAAEVWGIGEERFAQATAQGRERARAALANHRATLDGWMFQVPLTTRISHGYLFNDTITSVEQAKINFSKEINVPVDQLDNIEYKFKPFWAKTVFENRVIKNGNAAVFFEPMFANSLANYDDINKNFHQFLTGKCTESEVNIRFLRRYCQVRDIICYIYHHAVIFSSRITFGIFKCIRTF
jgi:hypothetical protein